PPSGDTRISTTDRDEVSWAEVAYQARFRPERSSAIGLSRRPDYTRIFAHSKMIGIDVMALAKSVEQRGAVDVDKMAESAREATEFLKALAYESRLLILCDLLEGEKSVGELETFLDLRQSTVSQQLARLRLEGLVAARREGKTIYY